MADWVWNRGQRQYRLVDGARTVGESELLSLREQYILARQRVTDDLARRLGENAISLEQWAAAMRQEIKTGMINQYMLANGGRNNMTNADWGRVGNLVKGQYRFFDGFMADAPSLTPRQIELRARMYIEASSQAFERAKTLGRGLPDLPAYPGDGTTQCLSNCACAWRIVPRTKKEGGGWNCYWALGAAEHCPDCVARAARWNPLVIPPE